MATREEIREEMIEIAEIQTRLPRPLCESMVDLMLSRQSSQGVVIKVDRELPFPLVTIRMDDPRYQDGAMIHAEKLMLKAGYVATEPLI